MLQVVPIHNSKRYSYQDTGDQDLMKRLNHPRSQIPAVNHVDFSARCQTVTHHNNPYLYAILQEFEKKTGVPTLVYTSFNVRGEPIVCTTTDAYRCMMRTQIDCIVLENMLLWRKHQPEWNETGDWKSEP